MSRSSFLASQMARNELSHCIIVCKSNGILCSNFFVFAERAAATDSVIIGGIEPRRIVDDDHDRRQFVSRLGKVASETGTAV